MPFPQTVDQLKAAGYKFIEDASCRGPQCEARIEWWETPRGKKMPFEVDAKNDVKPHWASCVDADYFRAGNHRD